MITWPDPHHILIFSDIFWHILTLPDIFCWPLLGGISGIFSSKIISQALETRLHITSDLQLHVKAACDLSQWYSFFEWHSFCSDTLTKYTTPICYQALLCSLYIELSLSTHSSHHGRKTNTPMTDIFKTHKQHWQWVGTNVCLVTC